MISLDKDIKSLLPKELENYFVSIGEKPFRSKQVFSWLHKAVSSFDEMTDLSVKLRNKLAEDFIITTPVLDEKLISKLDGTAKYLWRLSDGEAIESVLMTYEHGLSICISTQVGCTMGCLFCASGIDGLHRNLTASEMLDQVLFTQSETGNRISNIVLMGIGEPLDNFENVIRFLELVTDSSGINTGARHITLSTCGIIENIDKLGDYGIQLTLAISLHAPDDITRRRLIPIARKYSVDELLKSCYEYYKKTGRRVTYEYALINEVNDTPRHAKELINKLKNAGSHINIMFLNYVAGCDLLPSNQKRADAFIDCLKQSGLNYSIRRNLGNDISAACGLLRQRKKVTDSQKT